MNPAAVSLAYSSVQLLSCRSLPLHRMRAQCTSIRNCSHYPLPDRVQYSLSLSLSRGLKAAAVASSDEGPVSVISFEDFAEKDWSFLDEFSAQEEHARNIDLIISAGAVKEDSRVLVAIGSEGFVDRLMEISSCNLLLMVHDSLFLLACLKEKYDNIKCWQGELIHVPEKWAPFDVVFLYFLPALPFKLGHVLGTLARRCSAGARLVISHPQGREVLEQQRKQYQDVITSELPDKVTLEKVAADHNFEIAEFVDDQVFYLAVLKFSGATN